MLVLPEGTRSDTSTRRVCGASHPAANVTTAVTTGPTTSTTGAGTWSPCHRYRLASATTDHDDVDQAIEDLLNDDRDDRPREGDDGTAEEPED